jgi:hypothetical protein
VNLINDVNLEFAARREADVIAKFTNLINAIVARAVDLKHIKADPLRYLSAGVTDSARIDGRALDAVHSLGQNTGSRSFACAARADEKVSVSQALLLNGILQRSNNVILAENVVENLGSIFSRKDLVTHADNVVSRPRNSMPFVSIGETYRRIGVSAFGLRETHLGLVGFEEAKRDASHPLGCVRCDLTPLRRCLAVETADM